MQKITKAIIPAAGLGTRFLPQTKAMPKEMLPIIDKPLIQLAVEELVGVGVTDIIIVTGAQKRAIEDHFDRSLELEEALRQKGKDAAAEQLQQIAELANFVYVRQKGLPNGSARPILNAAHLLGGEPFYMIFPDDFFVCGGPSSAEQLLETYQRCQSPVLSLIEVSPEDTTKFGIVEAEGDGPDVRIKSIVEKPPVGKAPSNLASVGGYILTYDMLPYIEQLQQGIGGEIILADALQAYAQDHPVAGRVIDGQYYDGGDKLSYLKAVVDAAVSHKEYGEAISTYLQSKFTEA